jgi:predicted O-methyltransferase YrrM
MKIIANIANRALGAFGLRLARARRAAAGGPYSALFPDHRVPDIDGVAGAAATIPGMVSEDSGKLLFSLCYAQQLQGDVVEIGSWQGYSTSFLARAVIESGNGRLFAIDHFLGNAGKERFYVAGREDLSDLPRNFALNMERLGLSQTVTLLAMPNSEAAARLRDEGARVRFLFIDGDHSPDGVRRDVDLCLPYLLKGAIVVFDDCSPSAPGVIRLVDELIRKRVFSRAFACPNTLVAFLS